jgi:hypothetical protein
MKSTTLPDDGKTVSRRTLADSSPAHQGGEHAITHGQ